VLPDGNGTGLRMAELPATPIEPGSALTTVPYDLRFEEEHEYTTKETSTTPGERWFWERLYASAGVPVDTFTTSFDLPHINTSGSFAAEIHTDLGPQQTYNPRCFDARVVVNDAYAAEKQWTNSYEGFDQIITLPPDNTLSASGNTFFVEQTECDGDAILMLSGFTVRYLRNLVAVNDELSFKAGGGDYRVSGFTTSDIVAFKVADISRPQRLSEVTASDGAATFHADDEGAYDYLLTTRTAAKQVDSITQYVDRGLRTDLSQTDYILITHPDFATAVQPLLAHRQSEYTARLVLTTDIYNDFGDGSMDPAAIRAFLQYAYLNWDTPSPSFVALVGDGTYDPLNYIGAGEQVWVPPMLVDRDNYLNEVPSDNEYVADLAGDGQDDIPDMHIGRLPVNSAEEASALVQKIIQYEAQPPVGDWKRQFLFVADNPDNAGNFHAYSDGLLPHFPAQAAPDKAYLEVENSETVLEIRDTIKNTMDRGALIVQYIGHGSPQQWASTGGVWTMERYVSGDFVSDLSLLRPSRRPPMSLTWACWDGYFVTPGEPAIAESMIRMADRGTIAAFSPVGLDTASGHDRLAHGLYQLLTGLDDDGNPTGQTSSQIGPLTEAAKLRVVGTTWERLIYTYILFGDPATRLSVDPCLYDGNLACSTGGHMFMPMMSR
ncbi:MAG: C25 family cysteine peptidase, partial [Ardenticatenaceae bacterium]